MHIKLSFRSQNIFLWGKICPGKAGKENGGGENNSIQSMWGKSPLDLIFFAVMVAHNRWHKGGGSG